MLSYTEENYLKIIFTLSYPIAREISTNDIARSLNINPASVSDMLKKLKQKNLIDYTKYQGVSLTEEGRKIATNIIRKHRLWETFLVNTLNFSWDEVHDVAEQLEHIQSNLLIERLYEFLGFPEFDPHGEPIPNENGIFPETKNWICLNSCNNQQKIKVKSIIDDSSSLLQYLDKISISIGTKIEILEKNSYDKSIDVLINETTKRTLSKEISEKIYGVLLD
ncbi:MAG: metal-dependent transcriptional regulator [Raineya sp.]